MIVEIREFNKATDKNKSEVAKIMKQAKGFYGVRKSNYRAAKDAVEKSLQYSYRDRKARKRDLVPN